MPEVSVSQSPTTTKTTERRQYHLLRATINAIARSKVMLNGLPDLMQLGLPDMTRMVIRQIYLDHGDRPLATLDMNSPLDNP
jgi:hypothetical protein